MLYIYEFDNDNKKDHFKLKIFRFFIKKKEMTSFKI